MSAGNYPPLRALLISLAALAIPVVGNFWVPEALEDYEALLWILAVVPAFLWAYHKAWRGASVALAGAMAAISVTYAITQTTGRPMPELMLPIVVILIALSLGIGGLADRIYRDKGKGPEAGFTDPATGLPNRAHAELHLEIEFNAATMGRSVTVVLFELDNFKAFNSRHGTIAGDEAVRIVAETLKKITRRTNLLSRYAEDEFFCILSGSDENGAIGFVNRFQQTLLSVAGQRQIPPISGGIASIAPEMKSHHDLIAASRTALKQAKKDGHGRVRVYGNPLAVPMPGEKQEPAVEPHAPVDPKAVMPQGRGRGRKALIVAEQAPVRALLARYLADHGFNVTQVSNVVDGVQCLSNEFDLLFTDISLYEGIGVELVRAAKLRWASIQVIGLVNNASQGNLLIETLNAGVDRYLVTPLDLQKVREHITDLLARRDRLVASVVQSRQLTMEAQARTNEAVKALRETEEEYRSVMRSVHEVIFRIDLDGNFTFLNDAWEELSGQSVQASMGKRASDFMLDAADFDSVVHALTAGKQEKMRGELRVRGADGGVRWVEVRARRLFDADNNITGVSGTFEDVTARKTAEDRLRRSEAASRGLLSALPDEVLLLSRAGVVLNHEGAGAERAHSKRAVGSTVDQVFPGDVANIVREMTEKAFATGEVQIHEYQVTDESDEPREFEVRVAPSDDDEVVAIIRNITQRKTLEEQLRQSQKLEAIGRLAGGLAHDFNNLLTVVQGNAHLLSEDLPADAPAAEYVRQITTAADRGASLVRQLLAFGRKQVMQPSVLNVNALVEDTRSMLARLIGEHIRLEVDLDPEAGLIRADAGQIEQVLVNLAVNAREVMREGGVLRIATRNGALVAHGTEAEGHDNMVLLTVSDNGPGMDARTRERVFEPFFSTKGLAESSGLGLATVYGIVRQSGGVITVASEPGQGTAFEIALPRITQ